MQECTVFEAIVLTTHCSKPADRKGIALIIRYM